MEKSGESISIQELKCALKKIEYPGSRIQQVDNWAKEMLEQGDTYAFNSIKGESNHVLEHNKFINDILKTIDETAQIQGENTSSYLERIMAKRIEFFKNKKDSFNQAIKSKLTYLDNSEEKIVTLTKEEVETLKNELNEIFKYGNSERTVGTSIDHMAYTWKHKYISGGGSWAGSDKSETAILQSFPRYNSGAGDIFDKEPVYRFLSINDVEGFLKQFEKAGSEYSYPKLQSCAKYRKGGDTFMDYGTHLNVKFVIHPKSGVSKAHNIGKGKYGNSEIIYPANAKFRYIGKVNEEIFPSNYKQEGRSFDRWEIHLQEM
jgi:hypothetical protein